MAAERNADVMGLVRKKLRESRDYSTAELKEAAEEIDPDIRDLSARQFNARYPLQVRRELAAETADTTESRQSTEIAESGDLRSAVRHELLEFAKSIARAEDRGKLVDVLGKVDEHVDRVMAEV